MSDTTALVTAPVTPAPDINADKAALAPVVADLAAAVPTVKKVIADIKAGGIQGAIKDLPEIVAEGEKLAADVKAALPTIKAGWKTTEFWLVAGVLGVITGFASAGHPLPVEVDGLLIIASGIYAAVRGMVKKNATA